MNHEETNLKKDCYWFKHRYGYRIGCGVLVSLQCVCNGKCSFYETELQYKIRQDKFKESERQAFEKECKKRKDKLTQWI